MKKNGSQRNDVPGNPMTEVQKAPARVMGNLKIGASVEVLGPHWLRAGQMGTIIATKDRGINHWLVEFPETCEGGGMDGNKLWLNEGQLRVQT